MKNRLILFLIVGVIVISVYIFFFNKKELRLIAMDEIKTHNLKTDCWTTINDSVYDLTKFIGMHKGGDKILAACGTDATDLFTGKSPMGRVHSQIAAKILSGMKIGDLQK